MRIPSWHQISTDARATKAVMNLWPPYRFAGIRVEKMTSDFRHVRVRLGFSPLTRNYVGTQFGGSLFSMTDAFWMIMVLRGLGDEYLVWDKRGEIEFVKPGKGVVRAEFHVTDALLDELREATSGGQKALHWVETAIRDERGETVAIVRKQLYVRRKRRAAQPAAQPAAPPARR
ncbi:DUF4442 domain-containing protein [Agrococcus baldri]|uniref:DUF4442 domain-containing protein n=1 Tax=Agrococcus baldri TaxID=153730 RepID=A0AA87UR82_9MICO|nr:DUF4442 domain-containing protein [Agrococcus baldri]GEK79259.1 DUF4442 domain-containing protein [Agrococcus baldri]